MRASLHTGVLEQLGQRIVRGELPVGAVVTLAGLEAELGVSRSVVREVVRVLESIGMVESRQRVGVRVQPAGDWDHFDPRLIRWRLNGPQRGEQLRHLLEVRAAVEPVAARLAAQRADDATTDALAGLASRIHQLGDAGLGTSPEYLAADIAFHGLLLAAGGNPMLASLADAVAEVLSGRTSLGLMPGDPNPKALDHHDAIAQAIRVGDEDAAEYHARAIVMEVWDAVVESDRLAGVPNSSK